MFPNKADIWVSFMTGAMAAVPGKVSRHEIRHCAEVADVALEEFTTRFEVVNDGRGMVWRQIVQEEEEKK